MLMNPPAGGQDLIIFNYNFNFIEFNELIFIFYSFSLSARPIEIVLLIK